MQIVFNGHFVPAEQPLVSASNRGFKWGEGLFETLRLSRGAIPLLDSHHNRVERSLKLLEMTGFEDREWHDALLELCRRNGCEKEARLRIQFFRQEDGSMGWVGEAVPLPDAKTRDLSLGLHPFVRKSRDAYANLKSCSYLPYVLAADWARRESLDEALVLNTDNNLCDGSRTNLFLWKNGELHTPHLNSGCVDGVFRLHVLEACQKKGLSVHQQSLSVEDLEAADEVFLTNALRGIHTVRAFRGRSYGSGQTEALARELTPW